jgi:hypothetical protein
MITMVVAGVWVTPSGTRRKYVHVGSEPASLLATVPAGITHTPVLSSSILAANATFLMSLLKHLRLSSGDAGSYL